MRRPPPLHRLWCVHARQKSRKNLQKVPACTSATSATRRSVARNTSSDTLNLCTLTRSHSSVHTAARSLLVRTTCHSTLLCVRLYVLDVGSVCLMRIELARSKPQLTPSPSQARAWQGSTSLSTHSLKLRTGSARALTENMNAAPLQDPARNAVVDGAPVRLQGEQSVPPCLEHESTALGHTTHCGHSVSHPALLAPLLLPQTVYERYSKVQSYFHVVRFQRTRVQ